MFFFFSRLYRNPYNQKNMDPVTPTQEWETCCSRSSSSFVKYMVQVLLGTLVLLFSMVQIINKADNPAIYFSLISGTVGTFFPHPSMSSAAGVTQKNLRDELERQAATPRPPPRSLPEPQPLPDGGPSS
jgi:hypothetical protein